MRKPFDSSETWNHCLDLVRVPLLLAPTDFLADIRQRLDESGVRAAVRNRDTPVIFNWIMALIDRQGISNRAAISFRKTHGGATWSEVERPVGERPLCPRLRSYWNYSGCEYQKGRATCARPELFPSCPVPTIPARKGTLSQAAISLALFVRDVCDGDLVGWIDRRLADADTMRDEDRAVMMRAAVLNPLVNVAGTGPKVWAMILSELLLAGDASRERWVTAGASFVAVDTLVHAYLHRTGVLRRLKAEHAYGAACHACGGCVEIIEQIAVMIDAREFNPAFPAVFPRWIQFAIWLFCAQSGWHICHVLAAGDDERCEQNFCPSFQECDRLPHVPKG